MVAPGRRSGNGPRGGGVVEVVGPRAKLRAGAGGVGAPPVSRARTAPVDAAAQAVVTCGGLEDGA